MTKLLTEGFPVEYFYIICMQIYTSTEITPTKRLSKKYKAGKSLCSHVRLYGTDPTSILYS